MNLIIENNIDFSHLMCLGDTHGVENTSILTPQLLMKFGLDNDEENKAVIHVGDLGVGFKDNPIAEKLELDHLNKRLKKYKVILYVIRGNHDNPEMWTTEYQEENDFNFTNIVLVPDHTKLVLEVNGGTKTIYCNGGAYSVDRTFRSPGKSYWFDEPFVCPNGKGLAEIGDDINIVVTHTRPLGQHPVCKKAIEYWLLKDMTLDQCITEEGLHMKRLCDSIKGDNPKGVHFLCGHYHMSHTGFDGSHKHQILDINELVEIR